MENRRKAEKSKQEDIALTRALTWFAAAMVLEFLLLLANRYYVNFTADSAAIALALALEKVFRVLAVLGTAAGVLCGVLCWRRSRRKGELQFFLLVLTASLLVIGLGSAAIALFWKPAVQLLYIVVPACAVLALVYYLYQREFFLSACAVSVGLLGLWLVRRNSGSYDRIVIPYLALAALLLACLAALALRLKRTGGVLKLRGRAVALLSKGSNFWLIVCSCAVALLALAAGPLLGSTAAFYLIMVLVAWLFVLLVYYTVKLM